MELKEVDNLIKRLENEIVSTQKMGEQADSLSRLKEIAKVYRGEDKIISFAEIADRIRNEKEEVKMMSGFKGLDDLLKGFRPQQLIVVSALTGSGKTSFLMDMTSKLKEENPLWFPFEEGAEELIRKFLERGEEPPKAFTPENMKSNTMEWLESKIVESIAKFDTKIVFIDQLDFIVSMKGENHSLNVGQTMRDLKGLAKKWNIVIFIICHLTKAKMDTQPTLEDLKGSSSIGQEADSVILIWREAKRENGQVVLTDNVNVSVQKNRRHGKTGNVKMVYENGKFLEKEWRNCELEELENDLYDNNKKF
jgi:replicative DNA helicase